MAASSESSHTIFDSFIASNVSLPHALTSANEQVELLDTPDSYVNPMDRKEYDTRIKTFLPFTWFAKPMWLYPPQCARRGWENIDIDLLQCVTCRALMKAKMPQSYDPEVYKACCNRLKDSLLSSHKENCQWRKFVSPDSFMKVSFEDRLSSVRAFSNRVLSLQSNDYMLPAKLEEIISEEDWVFIKHSLLTMHSDLQDTEDNVLQSAAVLALTGWAKKEGALSCVVQCSMCLREVGLWNFHSLAEDMPPPPSYATDDVITQTPMATETPESPADFPTAALTDRDDVMTSDVTEDPDAEVPAAYPAADEPAVDYPPDLAALVDRDDQDQARGDHDQQEGCDREGDGTEDDKGLKRGLDDDPSENKRQHSMVPEKNTFDAVGEHRPWCPWVFSDPDMTSPAAAWRQLLSQLTSQRSPLRLRTGERPEISPHLLSQVRGVLNEWTCSQ